MMRREEKRALETALREHYRMPGEVSIARPSRALIDALLAEAATPSKPSASAIVAEQARRIGGATWALHAALAAIVALVALSGARIEPVTGAIAASCALASLAEVTRSRSCGMVELEAACAVNAQAVSCARALVLGCVDALALLVLAFLSVEGLGIWMALAQVCAPYLVALGAGLYAARKVVSADATAAAVTSAAGVCCACIALRALYPAAFASATGAVWWMAALLALAFAVIEARAWMRAAASAFADASPCASSTL